MFSSRKKLMKDSTEDFMLPKINHNMGLSYPVIILIIALHKSIRPQIAYVNATMM